MLTRNNTTSIRVTVIVTGYIYLANSIDTSLPFIYRPRNSPT